MCVACQPRLLSCLGQLVGEFHRNLSPPVRRVRSFFWRLGQLGEFRQSSIATQSASACRFFYASSACIYPEGKQLDTTVEGGGLKEADAWPAQPQDAYGLEKLASEEICKHYDTDFGIACRIARFHNIYGPYGTWKGGREKAPAAFCRKAICAQVRSTVGFVPRLFVASCTLCCCGT